MELNKATVAELSACLQKRELSSEELTAAYLDRIEAVDGRIGSYITVCPEQAREGAKAADARLAKGEGGALCGIPLNIKDNICTKGVRTTCGSKMLEDFVPPYNATVMEKLSAAGTVMLGKGNMDEFAMGSTCQTSYFGGAKNPYNTEHVPGGSSGGGAASVAAGLCAAALGSDTGGSIRQPAAFCGVTGLKPTYGAVSRYGLVAFASSLDQIGPIARSAEDCALLLSAIAGKDSNDGTMKAAENNYTSKIGASLKGMTIGLPKEFFGEGCEDEVKALVLSAARRYEEMGCTIKEVSLPSLKYAVAAYYLISSAEAASNLSRYDGIKFGYRSQNGDSYEELIKNTRREGFGAEVKRRIMLGNYALSSGYYDAYYKKAVQIRGQLRDEYAGIFDACDMILTPTAPSAAYRIGQQDQSPVELYVGDICTVTVNIAGLPAISTPCGYTAEGLPVGMSLIGRAFDEATIIGAADAFERGFERKEAAV